RASLREKEGAFPLILSRSSPSYPIDLTSYSAMQKTFAEIHQKHGLLDGLINCIGHLKIQPFHSLSSEEIDNLLAVNFKSFLYSCHLAQLKEGGHIVNLSSSSFTRGRKGYALYSSAKAAIVNFTQALAEEKPTLNINTIIPQRTNTSMRRENFPNELPDTLLSPAEVAQEIIALLKQEDITSTLIEVRKK
ncbi:MAG: SDR family oxidoreductase, partial [Simkania negevensis]|nr:SDR family oxidoreductase [Simkania negevensis]